MDMADTMLANGLTNRLIHSLRMQEHRGASNRDGNRKRRTLCSYPLTGVTKPEHSSVDSRE
jgi:hypothetical protein